MLVTLYFLAQALLVVAVVLGLLAVMTLSLRRNADGALQLFYGVIVCVAASMLLSVVGITLIAGSFN